jgi:ABC-2 type transport system permease protein
MKPGSILHVILCAQKASAATLGAWLLRASMMAVNNWIFFTMWFVLFRQNAQLGGWTLEQTMLLFGVSAIAFGVMNGLFGGFVDLPELVRDGGLNGLLLRPRSTLFLVLSSKANPSSWGDVVSGIVLIWFSGLVSNWEWLVVALAVALAGVVFLGASLIFFCVAFWLDRSDTLSQRIWETLITFGIYPEGIFPTSVRVCLYTFLPAAFTAFVPVRVILEPASMWTPMLVGAAIFWALLAQWVFQQGLRRFVRG